MRIIIKINKRMNASITVGAGHCNTGLTRSSHGFTSLTEKEQLTALRELRLFCRCEGRVLLKITAFSSRKIILAFKLYPGVPLRSLIKLAELERYK